MKDIKKTIALFVSALVMMTSCDKSGTEPDPVTPDPEVPEEQEKPGEEPEKPGEEPEKPGDDEPAPLLPNTFVINGESCDFVSLSATMTGENLSIAATPAAGYTDVESIMNEAEEYFFIGVSPILVGKEFDLMTEQNLYTVYSTLADAPIEVLAPGQTEEIASGKCLVKIEEETVTLTCEMEMKDGTSFVVHIVTDNIETQIVINENEIGRNDEVKPLRTAFYQEEDGLTYLYFTPANISYFSELSIATWYMYLVIPTDLVKGKEVSVDALAADDVFIFGVVDNVDSGRCVEVADVEGITGKFYISSTEQGAYVVSFEFFVNGDAYRVSFDGTCVSTAEEKPEDKKENEFKYGRRKIQIESVSLSKGEDVWTLSLNLENGKTAEVSASRSVFQTGGIFGFSQDKNMSVSYDGNVYSKANGYSGTLTVYLNEADSTVETEFTNYDDCEFYYCGEYLK